MEESRSPSERLDSWKAIAQYLQRDVATVRRWEKTAGLPVRRVPGGSSRAVFAYASELEAWLNAGGSTQSLQGTAAPSNGTSEKRDAAAPPDAGTRSRWRIGVAAALFAMLAIAGTWRLTALLIHPGDLRIQVTDDGAFARDGRGAELWRHPFPSDYVTAFSGYGKRFEVAGGTNPAVFIATGARIRRADNLVESGELTELTPDGSQRRRFRFDDQVTFDRKAYGPPWAMTTFAVDDRGGSRRIAVAAHHYEWSASMVTVLDDQFRRRGTYWQWGWIEFVQWLAPNRLLVGGFNDARDGGMVALLDPSALNGQSPEEPGAHGYCQTCGKTVPLRMVVMPRTELNRVTLSRFNRAVVEQLPDRIVARTIEVLPEGGTAVDVLYEFSRELDLMRASFSGPYWELHESLYKQGKISHDRRHCPDRDGPRELLAWDPASNWRVHRIR